MDTKGLHYKAFEETIKMLKAFGGFVKTVGKVEKTTGKSIEELYNEIISPENMTRLAERLPPDIVGKMFTMVFQMYSLLSKTKDLSRLSSEEKIEIGEKIINTAEQLEQLVKKAMEILEQKMVDEDNGSTASE